MVDATRPPKSDDVDPRVERSCRIILQAAVELLADVGFGGLTIEAVAARAGVGKSTIYRHWPGRLELIEDAIRTLKAAVTVPASGTARERVVAFLQEAATGFARSDWSSCLPALIDAAERDDELRTLHCRLSYERRQILIGVLEAGVESGEVPPGTDLGLLADCLFGPILVHRLLLADPFDPALVPDLVDQVWPSRN